MLIDASGNLLTPPTSPDVEYSLTADDLRRLTAIEAIAHKFGLVMVCPTCTKLFGAGKDGVEGKNDPSGRGGIELRCGHLRRVYRP